MSEEEDNIKYVYHLSRTLAFPNKCTACTVCMYLIDNSSIRFIELDIDIYMFNLYCITLCQITRLFVKLSAANLSMS